MPSTVPNATRRLGVILTMVTAIAAVLAGQAGAHSHRGIDGRSGVHVLADLEWDVVPATK